MRKSSAGCGGEEWGRGDLGGLGCIFEFEDVSRGLRAKEVRDVCI